MRITTLTLLLFILLGFAQDPAANNKVDLGDEFKIKNGQEVVGEKRSGSPSDQCRWIRVVLQTLFVAGRETARSWLK